MKRQYQIAKYVTSDLLMSAFGYTFFFIIRQNFLDDIEHTGFTFIPTRSYWIGVSIIPLIWLLVYYLSGYYQNAFRKLAINELWQTFLASFFGTVILFFAIMLNDVFASYKVYYQAFLIYMGLQFVLTYAPRLVISNTFKKSIRKGKYGFKTVIVGDYKSVKELIHNFPNVKGNILTGFMINEGKSKMKPIKGLRYIGDMDELKSLLASKSFEEVIVAFNRKHEKVFLKTVEMLHRYDVFIKITDNLADRLIGNSKLSPIYGTNLVELRRELMPPHEANLKRFIDVCFSAGAMLLLLPIYAIIAIRIKTESKGPVFYKQKRIGKDQKLFTMYKFRSMYINSEDNGPLLASEDDVRITPFGKYLRKYRLDEIPQFWNVLKGDMAVVGPRPEQQFFADQIIEKDPNYLLLFKVRPGITSFGMVKYGYAKNADEMVDRFHYDFIYLENMSLMFDAKVLFYTIFTIVTGKGV